MKRCARCHEQVECKAWKNVPLCAECVEQIVIEWWIRKHDVDSIAVS